MTNASVAANTPGDVLATQVVVVNAGVCGLDVSISETGPLTAGHAEHGQ
jgi:hypothetical protein